jgi:hypothetical protein
VSPPARTRASTPTRSLLPENFLLTDEHYAAAEARGFDRASADEQARRFADHHRALGSRRADWLAAFRTWLAKASDLDHGASTGGRKRRQQPSSAYPTTRTEPTDPADDAARAAAWAANVKQAHADRARPASTESPP